MNPEMDPSVTNCANCHSPMPRELRFCRNCGFRLGEGSAEYTETVRFQDVPSGAMGKNSSAASGAAHGFAGGPMAMSTGGPIKKRRRRLSGMSWLFIGLLVFFVAAAAFTAIVRPVRNPVATRRLATAPARTSFLCRCRRALKRQKAASLSIMSNLPAHPLTKRDWSEATSLPLLTGRRLRLTTR